MNERQALKLIKHTLDIMNMKDQIHDLQMEIFKLKNPEYKEIDLINYENNLLRKRLGKNGTD
jgi:hypothetical protein